MIRQIIRGGRADAPAVDDRKPLPWLHPPEGPWSEHRDINEVMLATSLAPEGFLIKRALTP